MNANPFGWILSLRLVFLIQFLWSFAYAAGFSTIISFLSKHFNLTPQASVLLLGTSYILGTFFGSIVGYLQDFYLGIRRSIYWGLFLFSLGFTLLFLAGYAEHLSFYILYVLISIVALGRELLGIAIYAILGKIYDYPASLMPRLDNLITINYVSRNTGIFLGMGFGWLFSYLLSPYTSIFIAGSVSIFTFLCSLIFSNFLRGTGNKIDFQPLSKTRIYVCGFVLFILLLLTFLCFAIPPSSSWVLLFSSSFSAVFLIYLFFFRKDIIKRRLVFFLCFMILLTIFDSFYARTSFIVSSYFYSIFSNFHFPMANSEFQIYQLVNTFFIICSGIFLLLWKRRFPSQRKISKIFSHFNVVLLLCFLSSLLLWFSTRFFLPFHRNFLWILIIFFLLWSSAGIIITYIGVSLCIRSLPREMAATSLGIRENIIIWPIFFLVISPIKTPSYWNITAFKSFFSQQFASLSLFILFFLCVIFLIQIFFMKFFFRNTKNVGTKS